MGRFTKSVPGAGLKGLWRVFLVLTSEAGKHFLAPKLQEGGESCSLTLSFPASFKLKTLLWFPPLGSSLEAVMKSHFL